MIDFGIFGMSIFGGSRTALLVFALVAVRWAGQAGEDGVRVKKELEAMENDWSRSRIQTHTKN